MYTNIYSEDISDQIILQMVLNKLIETNFLFETIFLKKLNERTIEQKFLKFMQERNSIILKYIIKDSIMRI